MKYVFIPDNIGYVLRNACRESGIVEREDLYNMKPPYATPAQVSLYCPG